MYRVTIHDKKYRAVLVGSSTSANVSFEHEDWRIFSQKLKREIEYEAAITLHGENAKRESIRSEPEISGIGERRQR